MGVLNFKGRASGAAEAPPGLSLPHLTGLRRRWITNTVAPVCFILMMTVILFSAGISSYYFGSMQKGLESRAQAIANSFNEYFMSGGFNSYYQKAVQSTERFEDKNRVELQFINSRGRIVVSTSGLTAGTTPGADDISRALSDNRMAAFQGPDPETGENIMAVSHPLVYNGRVQGVMRVVTSMRKVDSQVVMSVLLVTLIVAACMGIVLATNLIFINNVVEPVAEVTGAAKRISDGSYGYRIEKTYSDELGELVESINNMSLKIGQNEKMKTEFISSVSHELRTPLTAINGWGETILEDPSGDPVQMRRGIRIILNETRRLSNMVEELLEFSKMEDGRFTLHIETVDLQAELEDAIFTYRELFKQEGIALEYAVADEEDIFPPISGDPERLKQVICNVLDNAAKHGGAGKRISVSLDREGGAQVIRVRDYGPGIPEAELPFIKQKFYKGSSKARGSGIGLAVCDEIVKLHGGAFTIGNAQGGGAVVAISLPETGT
ncbi:MAG: HAMP domain-containing histidine kinase [Oscillibacter sp.]|nr:HAMP domain-containing histidine kinase [Oscillibacter sp.]